MPGEIVQALRHAVFREIGRRGADGRAAFREPPGDEARILQAPDADRQVPAFIEEVHVTVGEAEVERDGRVQPAEPGQGRNHLPEAEGEGHVESAKVPRGSTRSRLAEASASSISARMRSQAAR